MGPELEELTLSSAGTGLVTPGQQCPPNEGTWDQGRTTASSILTAGVGSSQGGNFSSPTKRATSSRTTANISSTALTPSKRRHKISSEENKQFDPGGEGEKARLGTRLLLYFLFLGRAGRLLACASCFVLCVCSVS